jgi:hypothetical protein
MNQTPMGSSGVPQNPPESTPSAQQPPAPAQPPTSAPNQPAQPKSKVWIWILGGCLAIVVLAIIVLVALGWWGARKVKNEIQKYTPDMERMKENTDKWNKESEEWQKKSEEYRENLPNPDELQNQLPADPNNPPQ